MNNITLKALEKQVYQVNTEKSHPKVSLRRVVWVRFLRWIDKAPFAAIRKTFLRASMSAIICLGVLTPIESSSKVLLSIATWNSFRIPLLLGLLALSLNGKRILRLARRSVIQSRGVTQNNYHGIPVGEFASWLMESRSFKRDDAMKKWGLSQGKYVKIAEELEKFDLLTRGENNARVLRNISLENLVLQLRDNFPLIWSEERQVWAERNGTFERWALSHDFKQRKIEEATERKERKLKRLDQKIQERSSFADVLALSTQTGL